MSDFDLAIIGGGINGTGIARDAAGRGMRVLLVEMNDLGSGTSSASSKLIHGGLRYLERGKFRQVREALSEREVLWRMAPHLIRPARFLLPPRIGGRSPLLLRFGLLIYDWLGARKLLPRSRSIDLTHHALGAPLKRSIHYGFEYSDCLVDDSRLVVLTAVDAAEHGATILTRTRCMRAERRVNDWELVLFARGRREVKTARALVNAAGPWIGEIADTVIRQPLPAPVRLVKGSHIVVHRRVEHDCGYVMEGADGRIVFALPFSQKYTLIGTTDEPFIGDLNAPTVDGHEIVYLCNTVNEYFRDKLMPDEIVWSFSGVRSLFDDGARKPQDVTRDYVLALDEKPEQAPLLTVYGGKITTYRKLAEAALELVGPFFPTGGPWTAGVPLPGGNFEPGGFSALVAETQTRWPFLSEQDARRLVQAYGRRVEQILGSAQSMDELGPRFVGGLTGAEVRYLIEHEWARTADDVLFRRSKAGIEAADDEVAALGQFMAPLTAPAAREPAP
jgi:glycerol-3-phosphate dehydrogenase